MHPATCTLQPAPCDMCAHDPHPLTPSPINFDQITLRFRSKGAINPGQNVCMYLRYKLLLLKIAIAFSVVWLNSTCFSRLYIFVLGGITFILFNVRLCGIIFAYSHLLAYCLLCGDMSVNPLLLITHCQDENRQLISFWNEYS